MKILHVVAARPNFMKAAPVLRALAAAGAAQFLVHTGQHYDANMSRVFFEELELPEPDVNLEVGSGSHAVQTAEVARRIEPVLQQQAPDLVLVYGDVNSTVAAALTACKLGLRTGHVEAGLRSFDRTMPEEINRLITDQMADLLFTHSSQADKNLRREGIPRARIHLVGNTMIDTLTRLLPRAKARPTLQRMGLAEQRGRARPYVLATVHRPSNVDDPDRLAQVCGALERIAGHCPVVFPAHPRTRQRMSALGIRPAGPGLRWVEPLGYLDFLCLQHAARAVITDSGGVQEETTYLAVPCFTLRPNTERPITITQGTNTLVNGALDALPELVKEAVGGKGAPHNPPELWDGNAAHRIARVIESECG